MAQMTPNQKRSAIAGLVLSATAVTGIALREGFREQAYIPVPGDVPTIGHGSTYREDGTRVEMGDTITRTEARALMQKTISNTYEAGIKKCAGDVPMMQYEFDAMVDMAYNLGTAAVCKSGMIAQFRLGNYEAGCSVIKRYTKVGGKDCTIPANKCGGIPKDRERVYQLCMGAK